MSSLFAPRESSIERKFVQWCKEHGWLALKLNVIGHRGYPDRIVLGAGTVLFIEFKRPGQGSTALQVRCQNELKRRGFPVHVATSVESAIDFITING